MGHTKYFSVIWNKCAVIYFGFKQALEAARKLIWEIISALLQTRIDKKEFWKAKLLLAVYWNCQFNFRQ